MGRAGAKNYKKEALLSVVSEILPSGAWCIHGNKSRHLKKKSCEAELQDKDDVKRHSYEKCAINLRI